MPSGNKSLKIWLTGSSGFIGSYLAPALQKISANLICFSHAPDKSGSVDPSGRRFIDFSSREDVLRSVRELGMPDVFIHLGWGAMVDPGADEHLTLNVLCAKNLIDSLYNVGLKRIVFIGSANEYGARSGILAEDMAPEGRMTNYARAKYEVTLYGLEKARMSGRSFVCVRPFYVFGAGQRSGSLINKLYRCYLAGQNADLGPCEHFRDYVHVSEVAAGIARLAQIDAATIVNIGSGNVIKLKDFVNLCWRLLGGKPERLIFGANPMRAGEPEQPYAYASLAHLKELTGWTPALTTEQGLRLTIEGLEARRKTYFSDVVCPR